MTIYLLGTTHGNQVVGCPGSNWKEFEEFLLRTAEELSLRAIAEELNDEAVVGLRGTDSVARQVCNRLGIGHLYCDPDSSQREKLGIPSTQELKTRLGYGLILNHVQRDRLDAETKKYWSQREKHWLSCFQQIRGDDFLFVFGSSHMQSFSDRLSDEGFDYVVIHFE